MIKMGLVQIVHDRVHWKTPYTEDDLIVMDEDGTKLQRFPPDVTFVKAPEDVEEGDFYDPATGTFTAREDMRYYVLLSEEGQVICNDIYSKELLEADTAVEVENRNMPPVGAYYYDGEFLTLNQFISKRFDKLEALVLGGKKK